MTFANTEAEEFWSGMAPTWRELEEHLDVVAGPPGRWAMERLALTAGERVLDIGCGTGLTTLALAGQVGAEGRVVGVDIAEGMLDGARKHAADAGVANVEFVHGDAQVHDLGTDVFDAAYSRFGVMFFADPAAAFTNVRRSIRPGGRLSFVCWQSGLQNEWMLLPGAVAMTTLGASPPMPGPEEPGPFAFADPARVRSILGTAGFSSVDVGARNDVVVTEEARIVEVTRTSMRVGMVRELLCEADDATVQRVEDAIVAAFRSRLEGGEVKASRGVNLVSAVA